MDPKQKEAENSEIETKFPCQSLEDVLARLDANGAVQLMARTFEHNLLLDTVDCALLARGCRLRLRQIGNQRILTFKRTQKLENGIAYREEIESDFSDLNNMQLIFSRLGYEPYFIYEKYRQVYQLDGTKVMVDETPIGLYVEIEGADEASIHAVSDKLGLDWESRIDQSYQALFADWAAASGYDGNHMVFTLTG
jgi:adenylate cyclase class 2